MKAIVNIGLRKVELTYTIKAKDLVKFSQDERNKHFGKDWELFQKFKNSNIICKQVLWFKDIDEWQSTLLFNGKTIDFHYDYEERKEFGRKKDWGSYVFQGYEYIFNEPQLFDYNVVKQVIIIF
jgi:hypothetical protein